MYPIFKVTMKLTSYWIFRNTGICTCLYKKNMVYV